MPMIASGKLNLRREQEKYPYNNLNVVFPKISNVGYDLFQKMFAFDPSKRISGKNWLNFMRIYVNVLIFMKIIECVSVNTLLLGLQWPSLRI